MNTLTIGPRMGRNDQPLWWWNSVIAAHSNTLRGMRTIELQTPGTVTTELWRAEVARAAYYASKALAFLIRR